MSRFSRLIQASILAVCFAAPSRAADVLPHAPLPDITPTYDGSGEIVEPDILYVPGGWHGYEYWMVVTPYTCGDETTENPSILAGHDGRTWEVPTVDGRTAPAPLVSNPEPCYAFSFNNNDPSLVLAGDSLFIYYAVTYRWGPRGGTSDVRRIASADGVNWTPGESAPVMWNRPNYLLSPTVVYDGSGFHAWYVQLSSCDARVSDIRHRQSADGITWRNTDDYSATMNGAMGVPYHLTVKLVGGVFAMLYIAYPVGTDCHQANSLYYAESGDGLTWLSL